MDACWRFVTRGYSRGLEIAFRTSSVCVRKRPTLLVIQICINYVSNRNPLSDARHGLQQTSFPFTYRGLTSGAQCPVKESRGRHIVSGKVRNRSRLTSHVAERYRSCRSGYRIRNNLMLTPWICYNVRLLHSRTIFA